MIVPPPIYRPCRACGEQRQAPDEFPMGIGGPCRPCLRSATTKAPPNRAFGRDVAGAAVFASVCVVGVLVLAGWCLRACHGPLIGPQTAGVADAGGNGG